MGYGEGNINTYWDTINNHFGNISDEYYKWWSCNNDVQIAQGGENGRGVGKWTYSYYTDGGNGKKLCTNLP